MDDRIRALTRRIHEAGYGQSLQPDFELRKHTSFQIGGPADLYFDPPSIEALSSALAAASEIGVPVTVLGGGTNVLVSDAGVRGLVVHLGKAFEYIRDLGEGEEWRELPVEDEDHRAAGAAASAARGAGEPPRTRRMLVHYADIESGASTRFIRLAKETVSRGLAGLEFAAGIPGSVGGAAQMNAGAFGGEISDCLTSMTMVLATGEIVEKNRAELDFRYRKLALPAGTMIASVRFRLLRSSVGRLQQVVARVQEKRRRHQPAGYPNAGSIFKNPPGEFAGRLIEKAGLKGMTEGGAQVSPDHANFIINLGGATAADVRSLMSRVQEEVWKKCGVWLEPEVRLVGEWERDEAAAARP
ncbi:MAG TPA: UDP-N-acetylmuramate dehydrogenase [Candidatus Limnocylindrales bacterium]|nr:UDP-N-acetylmuramate dehydrogenase [Candidatus Limnocylindrales bacterium]